MELNSEWADSCAIESRTSSRTVIDRKEALYIIYMINQPFLALENEQKRWKREAKVGLNQGMKRYSRFEAFVYCPTYTMSSFSVGSSICLNRTDTNTSHFFAENYCKPHWTLAWRHRPAFTWRRSSQRLHHEVFAAKHLQQDAKVILKSTQKKSKTNQWLFVWEMSRSTRKLVEDEATLGGIMYLPNAVEPYLRTNQNHISKMSNVYLISIYTRYQF
jgi:hypothetical protein